MTRSVLDGSLGSSQDLPRLPGSRQCQYNTRQTGIRSQRCIVASMGSTLTQGQHINIVTSLNMSSLVQFRDFSIQYQRMAPLKLTDQVLESIHWNKVPVELQREITTDGLVQQLLHKLLQAKAIIQERESNARIVILQVVIQSQRSQPVPILGKDSLN